MLSPLCIFAATGSRPVAASLPASRASLLFSSQRSAPMNLSAPYSWPMVPMPQQWCRCRLTSRFRIQPCCVSSPHSSTTRGRRKSAQVHPPRQPGHSVRSPMRSGPPSSCALQLRSPAAISCCDHQLRSPAANYAPCAAFALAPGRCVVVSSPRAPPHIRHSLTRALLANRAVCLQEHRRLPLIG